MDKALEGHDIWTWKLEDFQQKLNLAPGEEEKIEQQVIEWLKKDPEETDPVFQIFLCDARTKESTLPILLFIRSEIRIKATRNSWDVWRIAESAGTWPRLISYFVKRIGINDYNDTIVLKNEVRSDNYSTQPQILDMVDHFVVPKECMEEIHKKRQDLEKEIRKLKGEPDDLVVDELVLNPDKQSDIQDESKKDIPPIFEGPIPVKEELGDTSKARKLDPDWKYEERIEPLRWIPRPTTTFKYLHELDQVINGIRFQACITIRHDWSADIMVRANDTFGCSRSGVCSMKSAKDSVRRSIVEFLRKADKTE